MASKTKEAARQNVSGDASPGRDGSAAAAAGRDGSAGKRAAARTDDGMAGAGIGVVDVLRMLAGGLLLSCALSWMVTGDSVLWGLRPWFTKIGDIKTWMSGPLRLTDEQLRAYDGTDPEKPIYVGLNGTIYDVSANPRVYGPGGSYHFFAGRDAARAFITGCFKEDLTGDLRGVEEIYIPKSLDANAEAESAEAKKGVTKAALKIKREQARRKAKKQAKDALDHWHKTYSGQGDNKAYFKVGEIIREPGWLKGQPIRKLCESAEATRPMKPEGEE